jgi:hypothetical protein
MNFSSNVFNFRSDGLYIVVEMNEDMSSHPNNWKPIICCHSKTVATSYMNPNRKIYGPIPIADNYIDLIKKPDLMPDYFPYFDYPPFTKFISDKPDIEPFMMAKSKDPKKPFNSFI